MKRRIAKKILRACATGQPVPYSHLQVRRATVRYRRLGWHGVGPRAAASAGRAAAAMRQFAAAAQGAARAFADAFTAPEVRSAMRALAGLEGAPLCKHPACRGMADCQHPNVGSHGA
jgi:hypothetical protein